MTATSRSRAWAWRSSSSRRCNSLTREYNSASRASSSTLLLEAGGSSCAASSLERCERCERREWTVWTNSGLGALALLAEVPPEAVRDNADVAAISQVACSPDDWETLDAYGATGSLRRAAGRLHLHHSTVARRLEHLAGTLGIDLTGPAGLLRIQFAPATWQFHNS
ncbi:helix-turn-helix domain-containing protein [Streptomyces sp. NPDC002676]